MGVSLAAKPSLADEARQTPAPTVHQGALAFDVRTDDPSSLLFEAFEKALEPWNALAVGPKMTARLRPDIVARHKFDGSNTVYWIAEDWPYDPGLLAVTFTHVDRAAGEILEADIAINAAHHTFSRDGHGATYDLQNVLTHEVGHVLGLEHAAGEPEATMHARINKGELTKRVLHATDIKALQVQYGVLGTSLEERRGGCQSTPPSRVGLGALLAFGLGLVRRRRKGRS